MLKNMQNGQYIPGLDGLRAFAVLAVIAYHFNLSFAMGGFLGVDVFFVISGYLITSKILSQLESENKFSLGEFWAKRIRRLLPALYTMITTTFIWVTLFNRKLITTVLLDGLSSIIYGSNWWFIFHKVSYFDSFNSPSPLKNLWSLAIEEQFYIIWPIALLVGVKVFKNRIKFANIVFIIALGSAMLMGIMYKPGLDPSRVYYGTDTRGFELVIGCYMAIIYPINKVLSSKAGTTKIKTLNITSMITFTVFILSVIFMNEYQAFLYRGGMFLLSLNAAILTACICNPRSYLGGLLSWKPLSLIGKRSYGIYLWHYPIIVLSTPLSQIGQANGLRIFLQLISTFIIAELSYRYIEIPIQKYGFKEFFRNYNPVKKFHLRKLCFSKIIAIAVIFSVFITINLFSSSVARGKQQANITEILESEVISKDTNESPINENSQISAIEETNSHEEIEPNSSSSTKAYDGVLAIGDSVLLDIAENLDKIHPNITIDGKVGRQLFQAIELAPKYSAFNATNKAVIIELGTNAYFTDKQINTLLDSFEKAHIYLVNARVPRQWEKQVNKALSKKAEERDNVTLIDWYSASINHPEYFAADGVHLQPKGIEVLTALIEQAINENMSLK
ncbi:acyltransferase family protein [Clostridium sp.]|uniref:acyltransferase family protein n=1 Tax=Clostridium sp. TaxID=1506 RepID=UPI002FC7195D